MKKLFIAIILGALGYYMFIYDSHIPMQKGKDIQKTEDQKLLDEYGIKNKSYTEAISETYNNSKKEINDFKNKAMSI